MTLKEYITQLQDLAERRPEANDLQVIYAKDEEGNGYEPIHFSPSLGKLEGRDDFEQVEEGANSVLIN